MTVSPQLKCSRDTHDQSEPLAIDLRPVLLMLLDDG